MHDDAVWITGIGAATPLGHRYETIAENLLAGRSATRCVMEQQGDDQIPYLVALVDDVPAVPGLETAALPKLEQMALWSGYDALRDAGLQDRRESLRVGLVLGQASEWYRRWQVDWADGGQQFAEPQQNRQSLAGLMQEQLGLHGPTTTVGAACASANYSLALGRRWIEQGLVDVCLAGSWEIACPITRGNFGNLRALSRRFDDAEHAVRPFDLDRDGLVMGEGAVTFVLESAAAARRRGARAYAEVAGFGASSDASHMIIPCEHPGPVSLAMRSAMADAKVEPADVDYVNAHATGTPVGDRAESRAIGLVLGSHTKNIPVSSTKSMTGHLVSAAAAVEAIACIAAFEQGRVPPTINLDRPDPECDLCHVPHRAVERNVNVALSNSFGFGGSNTTLVLRKAG